MKKYINKGFTLIELLIVMAILGVLAVVVLVAINPAEQLARTRDAGRVSSVTQLGHAVQAYYTAHNATYPTAATWAADLSTSGELSSIPGAVSYAGGGSGCTGGTPVSNWCYLTTAGTDTIVYALLESKSYESKCGGSSAWIMYSSVLGKGGTVCAQPAPATSYTFKD